MKIRATVVKALAAGALLAGVVGVAGVTSASAVTLNAFYVSPHGTSSVLNTCTTQSVPCLTIQQALSSANLALPTGGGTIILAKGTYNLAGDHVALSGVADANTTITGPAVKNGKFKATISPVSTGSPVIQVAASGDVLENVAINGDGDSIPAHGAVSGIVEAGATINTVSVSNVDGSPSADAIDASGGTINGAVIGSTECTTTTTSSLPAGSNVGAIVSVKSLPKCSGTLTTGSPVTIGGHNFTVESAGKKAIAIDSGSSPAGGTASGSTVVFTPSVVVYGATGSGVACSGCSVLNSKIVGSGGAGQTGITAVGGANVQGDTVSANGTGIFSEVGGPTNIIGGTGVGQSGNTTSGVAKGIVIDGTVGNPGTDLVVANNAGGTTAGLAANCVSGAGPQGLSLSGNTASSSTGAGIALTGVTGESGADHIANNTSSGNGIGILLGTANCPGATATTGNLFSGNTADGNQLVGVIATGSYDPLDVNVLLGQPGPPATELASNGNTFTSNTWTGNSEANVADFNQTHGQLAPACAGATLATSIAANSPITSIDLKGANASCTLNPGTLLNVASFGIAQQLYVTSACNLVGASLVPVTCQVSNAVPVESLALNPGGALAGVGVGIGTLPNSGSANIYTGITNSSTPDVNGSSSFAAITGNAGYWTS